MAKKLPFKTAPKKETVDIGSEKHGIIEMPVLGDITVREQAYINDKLANQSNFLEIARISNKVARAEKIDPLAAHKFLTKVIANNLGRQAGELTKNEQNWQVRYAREIEHLSHFLLKNQWERQTVTAAALIRFRVEGCEDFTPEDANDMSQMLIQELYGFAILEQTGDTEEDLEEELEQDLIEQLGK